MLITRYCQLREIIWKVYYQPLERNSSYILLFNGAWIKLLGVLLKFCTVFFLLLLLEWWLKTTWGDVNFAFDVSFLNFYLSYSIFCSFRRIGCLLNILSIIRWKPFPYFRISSFADRSIYIIFSVCVRLVEILLATFKCKYKLRPGKWEQRSRNFSPEDVVCVCVRI